MAVVMPQGDTATKATGPCHLVVGRALQQIEFLVSFVDRFLDATEQQQNSRTGPGGDRLVESRQIE